MILFVFKIISILCNNVHFIHIFQIASSTGTIDQLVLPIIYIYICVSYVYVFLSNYIGQEVIDHNNLIFDTA